MHRERRLSSSRVEQTVHRAMHKHSRRRHGLDNKERQPGEIFVTDSPGYPRQRRQEKCFIEKPLMLFAGSGTRWGFIYKPFQLFSLSQSRFDTFSPSHHAYIKGFRLALRTFLDASFDSPSSLWMREREKAPVFWKIRFLSFFRVVSMKLYILFTSRFSEEGLTPRRLISLLDSSSFLT